MAHHRADTSINQMAVSATLHCLTGCALGEITGLIIGTALGLSNMPTIILAIALAFLFGYTLSTFPLTRNGMKFGAALSIVLAADTLSILTMEIVDNIVMLVIPGAMEAGLVNPLFWITMPIALTAAFFAAVPVNKYLLRRGRGHALMHDHHHSHDKGGGMTTSALIYGIIGLILGGLIVSAATTMERTDETENAPHAAMPGGR